MISFHSLQSCSLCRHLNLWFMIFTITLLWWLILLYSSLNQYQYKWLNGTTRLWNDMLIETLNSYSLTHPYLLLILLTCVLIIHLNSWEFASVSANFTVLGLHIWSWWKILLMLTCCYCVWSDIAMPHAGSGVVRMDPLRFLAGCRTRRLNQV